MKQAFEGNLTKKWRKENKESISKAQNTLKYLKNLKLNNSAFSTCQIIDDSNVFLIPKTWSWIPFGLIIESIKNGIYKPTSFYNEDGIACLRMYNIENGSIVWKNIKRMNISENEITEYGLNYNDLLVNRVNSRELVGKTAIIPQNLERCVYESKNIRVRLLKKYFDSKLASYWFQFFHRIYFHKHAQQTVNMASINQKQLSQMPIPLIPILEQHRIVSKIESIFAKIDAIFLTVQIFVNLIKFYHNQMLMVRSASITF